MTIPEKTGPARVERIIEAVKTLGVKAQLQVLDSIKDGLIIDGPHGIRYTARSVLEYKRSTKNKAWDAPLEAWIASFGREDVFFDIGANTGAFSLLAGRLVGDRVKVYAIEPAFETFEALVRNILANDLSAVITPLPVGLFDETRIEVFNYQHMGAGSARHALGAPIDHTRQSFAPVATQSLLAFRLDDLVDWFQLPRPTRIKLDVDGLEHRVIAGATRTLSSGPCELWLELTETETGDPAPARMIRDLGALGFTLTRELGHDVEPGHYPRVYDALFVRR